LDIVGVSGHVSHFLIRVLITILVPAKRV